MNLDDWRLIFISICLFLVLAVNYPLIMANLPIKGEKFFAIAVLGEEEMTENYYPNNDPNIDVGEELHWNLYIHNNMGEVRYVAIRAKLLNSTMTAPNSTSCSYSPASVVYEVRRVLLDNEVWVYPFSWNIAEIERFEDITEITQLSVNQNIFEIRVVAKDGYNFRMVFELWVYDSDLDDFRYGWSSGDELYCAWTQLWFNATLPELSGYG